MGNNLFGANISGQLAANMGSLLNQGVLRKLESAARIPGKLSEGVKPIPTDHTFRGMLYQQSAYGLHAFLKKSTLLEEAKAVAFMLADTVSPLAEPEVNDEIIMEGKTLKIIAVPDRDPDAASFICQLG